MYILYIDSRNGTQLKLAEIDITRARRKDLAFGRETKQKIFYLDWLTFLELYLIRCCCTCDVFAVFILTIIGKILTSLLVCDVFFFFYKINCNIKIIENSDWLVQFLKYSFFIFISKRSIIRCRLHNRASVGMHTYY